jgi:hypothetical protein
VLAMPFQQTELDFDSPKTCCAQVMDGNVLTISRCRKNAARQVSRPSNSTIQQLARPVQSIKCKFPFGKVKDIECRRGKLVPAYCNTQISSLALGSFQYINFILNVAEVARTPNPFNNSLHAAVDHRLPSSSRLPPFRRES